MYHFREEKRNEIVSRFKLNYLADEIGISLAYLSRILNSRKDCKKVVAYCITKLVDNEKEVDYFFEKK